MSAYLTCREEHKKRWKKYNEKNKQLKTMMEYQYYFPGTDIEFPDDKCCSTGFRVEIECRDCGWGVTIYPGDVSF